MASFTITSALFELKKLDNRIKKIVDKTTFIICETNTPYEDDFMQTAITEFDLFNHLVERRNKIKNAIMMSNMTTMVEIAGNKMNVSEALEFKETIGYKMILLESMIEQRQQVSNECEVHKSNPIKVFDPLNLDSVIKTLENEIEDFFSNVDDVLSESNDLTKIVV
jgi:hypothetical protein